MNLFQHAVRTATPIKMAIQGSAGSGKTYTALKVMSLLHPDKTFAVIDTEGGSASLYSDEFNFDVLVMPSPAVTQLTKKAGHHPENYIWLIQHVIQQGYPGLIIDSGSHEWMGGGGALDLVDSITAASRNNNKFGSGWRVVSPLHQRYIETILDAPLDLIMTLRSKSEYVMDEKNRPQKVGLAAIQRDGMDFEFSIVLEMDAQHNGVVTKTRCRMLTDRTFHMPGEEFTQIIKDWRGSDEAVEAAQEAKQAVQTSFTPSEPVAETPTKTYLDLVNELMKEGVFKTKKQVDEAMQGMGEFNPADYETTKEELIHYGRVQHHGDRRPGVQAAR